MKHLTVSVLFCLFFSTLLPAQKITGLQIGDKAPNLSPFKWIKGKPVASFEKGRIYVVEFGATWCVPCAAAIPELSSISDSYPSTVSVVSVFVMEENKEPTHVRNPRYVEHVRKYVEKKANQIRYTVAVDNPGRQIENSWLQSGNRTGIPYVFVIDKDGRIAWIGSSAKEVPGVISEIESAGYTIERALAKHQLGERAKVSFDDKKLLLLNGNGGNDDNFLFRSLLTKYKGDIYNWYPRYIQSYQWRTDSSYQDRVQVLGRSIAELYYLAYSDTFNMNVFYRNSVTREFEDTIVRPHHKSVYGKMWHLPVLEVSDMTPFIWEYNSTVNRYNYSLKVPHGVGSAAELQRIMQNDLDCYFGYHVTVEQRNMPYWRLSVNDLHLLKAIKSKDQQGKFDANGDDPPWVFKNAFMRDVISHLGQAFGFDSFDYGKLPKEEQASFIDETNFTDKIDFHIDRRWTFQQAKEYLHSIGLKLEKTARPMHVVVIRD